jgi:DUF4097 and DUF4098 domain-containing protein YvlB
METFGVKMKKLILVISCLVVQTALAASETKEFDTKDMTELSIENQSGKIKISSLENSKASVTATKNKFSEKCTMTLEKKGMKLVVKVEKTNSLSVEECDVDFDIKVPKGVDTEITQGMGSINISGLHGTLEFKLGLGDIMADGSFKKVDGKSGSGKVELKGLSGPGELKTGKGDILLSFNKILSKGEFEIKSGMGDATVLFPKGSKIKSSFKAGSGDLSNELGDSADADFKISMKTGMGSLKIKAY